MKVYDYDVYKVGNYIISKHCDHISTPCKHYIKKCNDECFKFVDGKKINNMLHNDNCSHWHFDEYNQKSTFQTLYNSVILPMQKFFNCSQDNCLPDEHDTIPLLYPYDYNTSEEIEFTKKYYDKLNYINKYAASSRIKKLIAGTNMDKDFSQESMGFLNNLPSNDGLHQTTELRSRTIGVVSFVGGSGQSGNIVSVKKKVD